MVTDDSDLRNCRVPLDVEGAVVAALSVKPSPLMLSVAAGGSVSKPLVVQAKRPFQVVGVTCPDSRFSFVVPTGAKAVQLVPVKFTAGNAPGSVSAVIRIETDLAESRFLEVKASAQITAPAP